MLQAVGLTKRYRGVTALAPLDLTLNEGECVGLAGANGSGKSTLLSLLAQTQRPDGGDILADGTSVLGRRSFVRSQVGYVPQRDALLEDLRVSQQLRLWQGLCGVRGGPDEEVLHLLGLEPLMDRPIHTLSGGMKKRVSIAMALLTHPRYLLMDEAFAGLDEGYRGGLTGWLLTFVAQGGALLWCSHESDELRVLCGQVLVLDQGRISQEGFHISHH